MEYRLDQLDLSTLLEEFKVRHNHKPRVLHIGNIANNAYNNAKLFNEHGFDCDVICPNYYHIMGCPEWEDAEIDGDIGDQFRPDWTRVDLNGFHRPEWFVQGPIHLCIKYLYHKRTGNLDKSNKIWETLSVINRTREVGIFRRIYLYSSALTDSLWRVLMKILDPHWVIATVFRIPVFARARSFIKKARAEGGRYPGNVVVRLVNIFINLMILILSIPLVLINKITGHDKKLKEMVRYLNSCFNELFPDRSDDIKPVDIGLQVYEKDWWDRLFRHYDFIQGYAVDPIMPMLSQVPYFAFEHGTLRTIPFEKNATGRLTALAYAKAEQVFVTNTDCIANARLLAGERVTVIPHPFDERRMDNIEGWTELRKQLCDEIGADLLIFWPTRHDWVKDAGYADKANDVFIHAFSRLVKKHNLGIICCRWGHNVRDSSNLFEKLGCSERVKWMEPMCLRKYERMMKACDVIADQFLLGAFGGVTFRGLAAGRPVCTYLNEDEIKAAYGEVPPIINCHTVDEITEKLDALFSSHELREDMEKKSVVWMKKYHSGTDTALKQAACYLRQSGYSDNHKMNYR